MQTYVYVAALLFYRAKKKALQILTDLQCFSIIKCNKLA